MQSTEDHKIFKTTQKKFGQNTVFKQRKTRTKENTHVEVSKITNSRKKLSTKINYNFFYALASHQRPRELQSHTMPSRPCPLDHQIKLIKLHRGKAELRSICDSKKPEIRITA